MLNSNEDETSTAHKNLFFFNQGLLKQSHVFILLINVIMPTIVGILLSAFNIYEQDKFHAQFS